jgi:hypothetical protein
VRGRSSQAATAAATQLAEQDVDIQKRNPIRATAELVRLTLGTGRRRLGSVLAASPLFARPLALLRWVRNKLLRAVGSSPPDDTTTPPFVGLR